MHVPQIRPCLRGSLALGALAWLTPAIAFAHVDHEAADASAWNVWSLTPDIVIATLLAGGVYIAGMRRRPPAARRPWRDVAYFSGVAAVFVALATPIDHMAEHLFSMHQIQHMLLRMVAPMLIALSAPQAMLISGLPPPLRRGALAPFAGSGPIRAMFGFLMRPVPVTILFIAALVVWEYPPYHDDALLNDGIHYTMHVTMLAAGLMFFWRIFDIRPAPAGAGYGTRLMMLWIVMLSNIALGAYTTLKGQILYPAYDVVGRLFDVHALTDETVGGFIIWVPSTMMCVAALIVVIHMWGRQEQRSEERRLARPDLMATPTSGGALVAQAASKNKMLALGVAGFALAMFISAFAVGVIDHIEVRARDHARLAHFAGTIK
jgi:putative membrane protein